jgi:hypothetical protein
METLIDNKIKLDLVVLLKTIELSVDLDDIFRNDGEFKTPYNILYTMAKENCLPDDVKDRLTELYNEIILNYSEYRKLYYKVLNTEGLSTETPTIITSELPVIEVPVTEETITTEPQKIRKLPKHYGKQQILKDIEKSGEKTELDRAMLALNDLRNLFSRLKNRGIKDKKTGSTNLSINECREIVASIRLLKNKLSPILNKK